MILILLLISTPTCSSRNRASFKEVAQGQLFVPTPPQHEDDYILKMAPLWQTGGISSRLFFLDLMRPEW